MPMVPMDDVPWPLIARAAEWERLRAATRGGAVIVGAAGVGKTRLAQEFARTQPAHRAPVVVVGSASASRIPLGAMSRLLPSTPPQGDRTPVETALAAVRSGEPVPDAITALWKDLGAARIDLGALSGEAVADLVAVALPGPDRRDRAGPDHRRRAGQRPDPQGADRLGAGGGPARARSRAGGRSWRPYTGTCCATSTAPSGRWSSPSGTWPTRIR
ncbi:MAG: hypothetical protein HOV87_34830 [Catenulispora sp.]|nr:hypothetical protein [Catenulispora sp.]